nr:hypothetical protein [Candidatus Sigynarchaeota archaeon]
MQPAVVVVSPANESLHGSNNIGKRDIVSPANESLHGSNNISFTVQVGDFHLNESWYVLDGGVSIPFSPNSTFIVAVMDGSHGIEFFANDSAGNTGTSGIIHFTSDTTAPLIVISSPANGTSMALTNFNMSISITDDSWDSAWYDNNGSSTVPVLGNGTVLVTLPGEGYWLIHVFANDTIGNLGQACLGVNVSFSIPSIEVVTPLNNTRHDTSIPVTITITSNSDWVAWYVLGDDDMTRVNITALSFVIPFSLLSDGNNSMLFFVNDSFGHVVFTGPYYVEKITWGKIIEANVETTISFPAWNLTVVVEAGVPGIFSVTEAYFGGSAYDIEGNGEMVIGPVALFFYPDGEPYTISFSLSFNVSSVPGRYRISSYDSSSHSFVLLGSTVSGNAVSTTSTRLGIYALVM